LDFATTFSTFVYGFLTINPGVGGGTGVESYSPSGPQVLSSGQTITFAMEIANVDACNGSNSTCSLDFSYGLAGLSGGYYGGFTCVFQQMMTPDQIDCTVNQYGGGSISGGGQSDDHTYMTISPGSDLKAKK
jgi:hypothetical protein